MTGSKAAAMHEYSQMIFTPNGIDENNVRAEDRRAAEFKYRSPTSKTCLNISAYSRFSCAASIVRIWDSHHVPALRANTVQQHSASDLLSCSNAEKLTSGRFLGSWM